jgi:prepilin-type N-terminal cleavage/methylation domain-containing protein
MKTMQKMKRSAFTLIELLVVIVIIGILLAVLFPAIAGALRDAKANALLQQGSNFAKAILTTDIQGNFDGDVYPSSTSTNTFTTSTDYFEYVIEKEVITGQDFALFGGAGAPAIKTSDKTKFNGRNNAWNVVVDVRTSTSDTIPLIFSRNLELTKLPDGVANTENLKDKLTNTTDNQLAFATTHLVVVTKSASGNAVLQAKDLGVGNANKLNPTNKLLDVLKPGT